MYWYVTSPKHTPLMHWHTHWHTLKQDLKPSNVLMTKDGSPVLTDFEISRTVLSNMGRDDYTITDNPNALIGTREFWPPEVVDHYQYKYKQVRDGVYVRLSDGTNIDTMLTQDKAFYSVVHKARDCWALGAHVCVCVWFVLVFRLHCTVSCYLCCSEVYLVSVVQDVCYYISFTRIKTTNYLNTSRKAWTRSIKATQTQCMIRSKTNVTREHRSSCLPAYSVCLFCLLLLLYC